MSKQAPNRVKFRKRLEGLLNNPPVASDKSDLSTLEIQAQWAKYLCVLISGYLEQSIKETLLNYAVKKSSPEIILCLEQLWPPKNMWSANISASLGYFDKAWQAKMDAFIDDAIKSEINGLIGWRNNISHGNDANTNGVTIHSMKEKLRVVNLVLDEAERIIRK